MLKAALLMMILTYVTLAWSAPPVQGQLWQQPNSKLAVIFGKEKALVQFPIPVGAFIHAGRYHTLSSGILVLTDIHIAKAQNAPPILMMFSSDDCMTIPMISDRECFRPVKAFDPAKADAIEFDDASMPDYQKLLRELGL